MANWDILKNAIVSVIKTNGNQEITGQLLQNTLLQIVNSVGENYTFVGVATPTTNPGTPEGPVFYLATTRGLYSNFNGAQVINKALILAWSNSVWRIVETGIGLYNFESIVDISELNSAIYTTFALALAAVPTDYQQDNITQLVYSDGTNRYTYQRSTATWSSVVTDWENLSAEVAELYSAVEGTVKLDKNSLSLNCDEDEIGLVLHYENADGEQEVEVGLQAADYAIAGLMTVTDRIKLDSIVAGADMVTDLYFESADSDGVNIGVSHTDASGEYTKTATIPYASTTAGGAMSSQDKINLENVMQAATHHPVDVNDSDNLADLDISDENDNVLARFENGHFMTKNFNSAKNNINLGVDSVEEFSENKDYAIGDIVKYNGLLYKFIVQHSAWEWDDTEAVQINVVQAATHHPVDVNDSGNLADLDISDENDNVLARFENGHFMTKNFNSAKWDFLRGKKVLFFGDSQTFYDNYVNAFVNMTGCIAYRRGYPGSGFENGATEGTVISFCDRVDAAEDNDLGIVADYSQPPVHIGLPSNIDYVILQGGANDFGKWETNHYSSNNTFGDINETAKKNSFVGAIRYVLTKLKEKYPLAPIFVTGINYIYRVNGGVLDMYATNVVTSVLNDPNSAIQLYEIQSLGKTVNDFNDAMKLVSSLYGAYYVDLTSIGCGSIFQNDREIFTLDGLHFSEYGGKLVAKKIFIEMQNNLIY